MDNITWNHLTLCKLRSKKCHLQTIHSQIEDIYIYIYIYILYIYIYIYMMCSCCNGYLCWKWMQLSEFKACTSLFTFPIPLIHLGKVWTQLFSPNLCLVISKTEKDFKPGYSNQSRRKRTLNSTMLNSAKK